MSTPLFGNQYTPPTTSATPAIPSYPKPVSVSSTKEDSKPIIPRRDPDDRSKSPSKKSKKAYVAEDSGSSNVKTIASDSTTPKPPKTYQSTSPRAPLTISDAASNILRHISNSHSASSVSKAEQVQDSNENGPTVSKSSRKISSTTPPTSTITRDPKDVASKTDPSDAESAVKIKTEPTPTSKPTSTEDAALLRSRRVSTYEPYPQHHTPPLLPATTVKQAQSVLNPVSPLETALRSAMTKFNVDSPSSGDIHGVITEQTGSVFGKLLPVDEAVESINKVSKQVAFKPDAYQIQYWSYLSQTVEKNLPPLTVRGWFEWEQSLIDDVIATHSQYIFLVDSQLPIAVANSTIHELRVDWWRARLLRCAPDSFTNRSVMAPAEIYTYLFRKFEGFQAIFLARQLKELTRGPQETSMEFRERANQIITRFEQLGSSPEKALELLVNGFVMLGLGSEAERDSFAF